MPSIYSYTSLQKTRDKNYSSDIQNYKDSDSTIKTVAAADVIESPQRRFVTDEERDVISRAMLMSNYDLDNDGVIDNANRSGYAESAGFSMESSHSESSNYAERSGEAAYAEKADVADSVLTVKYSSIIDVPEKFAPEAHTHLASEITETEDRKFVSGDQVLAWNSKQDPIGFVPENISNRGNPDGYAPLNADGKIPSSFLEKVDYDSLENKPESSVQDIDLAVEKSHEHANKNTLDKISENLYGLPIWGGAEWPYPGDMRMERYDADKDGIIDRAKNASSVDWTGINDKPRSAVASIDDAVQKKHSHNNMQTLNMLGVDSNGEPTWNSSFWPFDMKSSQYDSDKDGVVDRAEVANSVNYANVSGKPNSSPEEIDSSVAKTHEHSNGDVIDQFAYDEENEHPTFRGKMMAYASDCRSFIIDGEENVVQAKQSMEIDIDGKLHLKNDSDFISPGSYYGTNENGKLGYHSLSTGGTEIPRYSFAEPLVLDEENNEVSLANSNDELVETNCYYGRNSDGLYGYFRMRVSASDVVEDREHKFVSEDTLTSIENILSNSGEGVSQEVNNVYNYNYTISRAKRETVLSAVSGFFIVDGSNLIIRASENTPLILSFSNGNEEIVKAVTQNTTIPNIPSIMDNGEAYVYAYLEDDEVKFSKTSLRPVMSRKEPDVFDKGKFWFDTSSYKMKVSNGNSYDDSDFPVLFLGEIIVSGTSVIRRPYSINGFFDSGWFNVEYSTRYNTNHLLGTDEVIVTAYKGKNNSNLGGFLFTLQSSGGDPFPVGDAIVSINETSVQTSRFYSVSAYSSISHNAIYGDSNQHRILVERAW